MTMQDTIFMRRALTLALKGKGKVHPNPLVGCVLVKKGRVIAEGFHSQFGGPHAESLAIKSAGARAQGATLYINLEPCHHWGKTPPCAPAIVKAGIKQVFISHSDPNPLVDGKGLRFLRQHGVKVRLGLEKKAAENLNKRFLTWMEKQRPYTILKMAMSLDGKIATPKGDSKWISSPASRNLVHKLRAQSDAVMVGTNTAREDNPSLTSHGRGRNPIRVVLDTNLTLPASLKIFRDKSTRTLFLTGSHSSEKKIKTLSSGSVEVLKIPGGKKEINLPLALKILAKRNISQLLVEGGGKLSWSLLSRRLVDEVLIFIAPIFIGGQDAKTPLEGTGIRSISHAFRLKNLSVSRLGPDIVIRGGFN